jgi:hypothetical protein
MTVCGKCATEAEAKNATSSHYAVRVGGRWVARFTYPASQADKLWEASEGLRLASHCKAILGDLPYLWRYEDSAKCTAEGLGGEHIWICERCVPKEPKKTRKPKSSPDVEREAEHIHSDAQPLGQLGLPMDEDEE